MTDLDRQTADIVRAALRERRLSQTAAAEALGITPQAFSDKLRGRRHLTLKDVGLLARFLGLTVGQLLDPPALLVDVDEPETPEASS